MELAEGVDYLRTPDVKDQIELSGNDIQAVSMTGKMMSSPRRWHVAEGELMRRPSSRHKWHTSRIDSLFSFTTFVQNAIMSPMYLDSYVGCVDKSVHYYEVTLFSSKSKGKYLGFNQQPPDHRQRNTKINTVHGIQPRMSLIGFLLVTSFPPISWFRKYHSGTHPAINEREAEGYP